MKLYSIQPSNNARRVRATAEHLGIALEIIDQPMAEMKTPPYLALNPNGKVPTLVDGDLTLWESRAIMQYVASKKPSAFWPTDDRRRAEISKWQFWDAAHLTRGTGAYAYENLFKKIFMKQEADPVQLAVGEREWRTCAPILNAQLEGKTWILGDELTLEATFLDASLEHDDLRRRAFLEALLVGPHHLAQALDGSPLLLRHPHERGGGVVEVGDRKGDRLGRQDRVDRIVKWLSHHVRHFGLVLDQREDLCGGVIDGFRLRQWRAGERLPHLVFQISGAAHLVIHSPEQPGEEWHAGGLRAASHEARSGSADDAATAPGRGCQTDRARSGGEGSQAHRAAPTRCRTDPQLAGQAS